ncbi:MAG: hypothetical protein ACFFAU_21590, partial [Candidatus Hodarchaeota archaeon]
MTGILFILALITFDGPISSNASYGVQTNDSWTFTVKNAQRVFSYSYGFFKGRTVSTGYLLGETKIPLDEQFNLTILSIESNSLENISFRINSISESITAKSSPSLFEKGIQDALGKSVLGEGNFLQNESGLNAGNEIFIAPNNISWLSLIDLWNYSTNDLPSAIDGIETVIILEDSNNEIDYRMRMLYDGTLIDPSLGINFDFTYDALFQWEKETGVLLRYEFYSYMQGTYNNTFSASFSMNLAIE